MNNVTTAQMVTKTLLNGGFVREAKLLERQLDKLKSNNEKERKDAAEYIRGLCSVRGLVDLNIKSMEHGEWERLLAKLVRYGFRQVDKHE